MSNNSLTSSGSLDRELLEAQVHEIGLPQHRRDPWKYTSPRRILDFFNKQPHQQSDAPRTSSQGVEIRSFDYQEADALVQDYVGTIVPANASALPYLNLLHANSRYVVYANHSQSSNAIVNITATPNSCARFLIIVEENTQLELVEFCSGGNRVLECLVKPNAKLFHRRLQPTTTSVEYSCVAVRVEEQASYHMLQCSQGANLRRNELTVTLAGNHANADLSGGWNLTEQTHLDNQIACVHEVGNSTSQQKFHGVVNNHSKAVFNGRICIARNAARTAAHMVNKNILTSTTAETYTKPELEIYADDVDCSHGATVGQLDQAQLRYIRSRGIPEPLAQSLLLKGFLTEIVQRPEEAELLGLNCVEAPYAD